jgi:hypothetical protein
MQRLIPSDVERFLTALQLFTRENPVDFMDYAQLGASVLLVKYLEIQDASLDVIPDLPFYSNIH